LRRNTRSKSGINRRADMICGGEDMAEGCMGFQE
jgi:hypothetical protein